MKPETEVYGLCLTIFETKMENFKNSVKTLNENSQAVQTKTRSLRAFWRILMKENTIFHCKADVSETTAGLQFEKLWMDRTEGSPRGSPTKFFFVFYSKVLLLGLLPENTLIFLPHVAVFLRYFENVLVLDIFVKGLSMFFVFF